MSVDPITAKLDRLYSLCRTPRHEQRIQRRWATYPALAGRSLDDIAGTLADPDDPDHNPVLADLLHAHRSGDPDASTVLLIALRPIVRSLVPRNRSLANALANAWAAVGARISSTDPDEVRRHARPFLGVLHGRIRRDSNRLHHAIPDHQEIEWQDHGRAATSDPAAAPDVVERDAIVRCTLTDIAQRVRRGDINPADWQQLVHHRFNQPGHSTSRTRADISRTSQRIARLVGHDAA
jgi:hypothetical protein